MICDNILKQLMSFGYLEPIPFYVLNLRLNINRGHKFSKNEKVQLILSPNTIPSYVAQLNYSKKKNVQVSNHVKLLRHNIQKFP